MEHREHNAKSRRDERNSGIRFPFRPFEAPPLFVLPNPWARAQWLHRFVPSGLGALQATMLDCDSWLLGYEAEGNGFFNRGLPKYFETRDAMIAFLSELSDCPSVYRPSVKK